MPQRKSSWIDIAIVAASCVFTYALVFRLPGTPFLMEADHHIFLYEGMRLFQGDRMYADFFEFTFPGTQAFYWLAFALFGLRYWVLGATIIGISGTSVWACLNVAKRVIAGPMYVIPALVYIFFGFRWLGIDGSHRMFSPIFVLAAVCMMLAGRRTFNYILTGALCSFASFFTQPRGIVALAALIIFVAIDAVAEKRSIRTAIQPAVTIAAAFIITLALLGSYFIITAGPSNFFYDTVVYPLKYYGASDHNNFAALSYDLGNIFQFRTATNVLAASPFLFYLFVIPATYVVFWVTYFAKGRGNWAEWRGIVLVTILGSLVTITALGSPNSARLFQIAILGLIVLGWMVARMIPTSARKRISIAAAVILPVLGGIEACRMQTWNYETMQTPAGTLAYLPTPVITERYNFLLEHTRPGDAVFEVYEPFVYFPLQLRDPTPYGQIWPSDYTRPEQVADALARLKAARPRYIIWDNLYNKPDATRPPGDHTGPLAKFVTENYHPANNEVDIGEAKIQIWERND